MCIRDRLKDVSTGTPERTQAHPEPRVLHSAAQSHVPDVETTGSEALVDVLRAEGKDQPVQKSLGQDKDGNQAGSQQSWYESTVSQNKKGTSASDETQPRPTTEGHSHSSENHHRNQSGKKAVPAWDPAQGETRGQEGAGQEECSQPVRVLHNGVCPGSYGSITRVHPALRHGSAGHILEQPVTRHKEGSQQKNNHRRLHPPPSLGRRYPRKKKIRGWKVTRRAKTATPPGTSLTASEPTAITPATARGTRSGMRGSLTRLTTTTAQARAHNEPSRRTSSHTLPRAPRVRRAT